MHNLLDDAFYESFQENPEGYGEEYIQELRDMGIQLEWDGAGYDVLRNKFEFLKGFSDEELKFIVENYNNTNPIAFNAMIYNLGELNDISNLEKGILEKYLDANLSRRDSYDFEHSLGLVQEGGSSNNFKSFINRLISEGKGENISVGLSIQTLSMLSKIGIEKGLTPPQHFGITDLNGGGDYRISGMYNNVTGTLDLDYGSFRRGNKEANQTTWGVSGAVGYGVATTMHEFGHHLEEVAFGRKTESLINGNQAISVYGNTNSHEAFAESFAAYCLGVEPTMGKEYHSNFKKLMKENGLSAFEGCVKNLK